MFASNLDHVLHHHDHGGHAARARPSPISPRRSEAAEALRPLAGRGAYWLFTLGLIGTGMLAVPVLAGSCAYAIAEAAAWRGSLDRRQSGRRNSTACSPWRWRSGSRLNYAGLNAIKLLFTTAVINGVLAPPLILDRAAPDPRPDGDGRRRQFTAGQRLGLDRIRRNGRRGRGPRLRFLRRVRIQRLCSHRKTRRLNFRWAA